MTDPETQPKALQSFADDVVGRFRSGHVVNRKPVALNEWRITTGDPDVAAVVFDLFGGDQPQTWDANGEDNFEVFSTSTEVEILVDGAKAVRQKMVWWSSTGKLFQSGDGETLDADGRPASDAAVTLQERKRKGQDGLVPFPQIETYLRLAQNLHLRMFKFQTGSWSLA